MKHLSFSLKLGLALTLVGFLFPCPAYAYLDPGTGSYVLQILVAGFIGLLFALKMYFGQLKTFLGSLFSRRKKPEHDNA